MIRRPPRSTLDRSSAASDVYKRQLDEPTSGLHFADIENLLRVLMKLRDAGNTLVVIEHNLEVIKCADWLIDLGPEGGERGGKIVDAGPPERIAETAGSYTGQFLRSLLQ